MARASKTDGCRFCGTGCGVIVGTKNGKVVATQGDPDAPVNCGLNCIKGYDEVGPLQKLIDFLQDADVARAKAR